MTYAVGMGVFLALIVLGTAVAVWRTEEEMKVLRKEDAEKVAQRRLERRKRKP